MQQVLFGNILIETCVPVSHSSYLGYLSQHHSVSLFTTYSYYLCFLFFSVRTLSNLKPDQDSGESSDEEEGQAFYAGGSEHSGQQVLGPPRGRRADIVSDMFRSVRA